MPGGDRRAGQRPAATASSVLVWRHADDQYAADARDTEVTLRVEHLPFGGDAAREPLADRCRAQQQPLPRGARGRAAGSFRPPTCAPSSSASGSSDASPIGPSGA